MRNVPVWDLPTRLFHWLLAVAVLVAFFVEPEDRATFAIHVYAGYTALVLVVFRLPWGVIGSRHSRFSDFLRGPRTVGEYSRALLRLKLPRYVGHNPLGGWMIVALLAAIIVAVLTGLFARGEGGAGGPFAGVAGWRWLGEFHGIANLIILLVVLHVLGVIVDIVLTRENIIRAMITGRKQLDEPAAAREPPLVSNRRALLPAAIAAAIAAYLFSITDFGATEIGGANQAQESDSEAD